MAHKQQASDTIFIVEDDNATAVLLSEILLQETTCQALLLASAWQVLQIAQSHRPLLFILDYYLPGMNGLELYDHLMALEGMRDVPVLIMGASLEKHTQEITKRGLATLAKPFDLEDFLGIIERLVGPVIRAAEQVPSLPQPGQLI
jgi:CheY-like chemotaxis protein